MTPQQVLNTFGIYIDYKLLTKVSELSAYEIVNFFYMYCKEYPDNLNTVTQACVITDILKEDFNNLEKIQQVFKLIDCSKIDLNICIGLLRGNYIICRHILEDYVRIRDYFYAITPNPKKHFFGLMEVEHE